MSHTIIYQAAVLKRAKNHTACYKEQPFILHLSIVKMKHKHFQSTPDILISCALNSTPRPPARLDTLGTTGVTHNYTGETEIRLYPNRGHYSSRLVCDFFVGMGILDSFAGANFSYIARCKVEILG
jgi:hypothetical protein